MVACVCFCALPPPPAPETSTPDEEETRTRLADWALRDAKQWQQEHGDRLLAWEEAEGHLAVVIDDVGRELHWHDKLQALRFPLTFSVLPGGVYARGAQDRLTADHRRPREILLHLPMEPIDASGMHHGPNATEDFLLSTDDEDTLRSKVGRALDKVDGAVGVNNHMGSRLTANENAMRVVMAALRERGLFFLDSRTTPTTVAERQARESGLLAGRRQVFLDHDPDPAAIEAQLAKAAALSRREPTVVIAHPSRAVVEILEAELPHLYEQKIGIYPASRVIAAQDSPHSPTP